mmetsp:Transcript_39177/g.37567  ORF Transcript_39177/g.37567 Transcript_39177/m.37567 type:complete len:97 (-) Transcript_39177:1023-1313(-)
MDANCKALFEEEDANNVHQFDEKDKSQEFMNVLTEYIEQKDDQQLQCPSFLLLRYYKFFTIITIKSILYPMVQNILVHSNQDRITSALSIIVSSVL